MDWYYAIDGQQAGPVEEAVIMAMHASGQLKPTDQVWHPSFGDSWSEVSTLDFKQSEGVAPAVAVIGSGDGSLRTPTANKALMAQARVALSGRWPIAIGGFLLYQIIATGMSFIPFVGSIAVYILAGPLALGVITFALTIGRGGDPQIGQLFVGFKRFATTLCAYLLVMVFTLLWMLLLIVPGIIASYSYAMTFYIIADDPEIKAREAITKSKAIMMGNKWKYFCLNMRFFGWALLCLLTLGIGFLWLMPYMQVSMARFYDDIA
ncbi:MAG: DUF975 family protein [Verrucomicrobia bacterium]|nr:DUF975 family protein [Verrucomicrobiota bacterium]